MDAERPLLDAEEGQANRVDPDAPGKAPTSRLLVVAAAVGLTLTLVVIVLFALPFALPTLSRAPAAAAIPDLKTPVELEKTPARAAGFDLGPYRFDAEEETLREWSWRFSPAHSSLQGHIDRLSPEARATRSWLQSTRLASGGGTGVGLGASSPRPARIIPPTSEPRSRFFPKPTYVAGSPAKFQALQDEWETGLPLLESRCAQGKWQDQYATLHADMMNGRREPRLMEHRCMTVPCGGIADRLLGMSTVILRSILDNRAFSLQFSAPQPPLDLLFDAPYVDWSQPFYNASHHPLYSNETLIAQRKTMRMHNWNRNLVDAWANHTHEETWIKTDINRGAVMRHFNYPEYSSKLAELGLNKTSAFSCLMDFALRPSKSLLQHITAYTSYFALPQILSIGIQIRTGDATFKTPSGDLENGKVSHYQSYFECADRLAAKYALPQQTIVYYLVSDSTHLKKDALKVYKDRVVVSGLEPRHLEYGKKKVRVDMAQAAEGFGNAIAEIWTLARTDLRVLTGPKSGFGKLATYLSGSEGTTVVNRAGVDCSLDSAFTPMDTLANSWSLGR